MNFSIDHWNLNSLVAHNFAKVALLKVCLSVEKFGIFRLSQAYLNSSVTKDDDNLSIPTYDLIRSDHPIARMEALQFITKKYFLLN